MRRRLSRSRLRYLLPWLLSGLVGVGSAGGALLAVLVQPGPANSPTPSTPPLIAPPTGFAGYQYQGGLPVTQIAAQWRVPEVLPDSPGGFAATWIGAENQVGDFIQIGTNELKAGSLDPVYVAFWSDAAIGFHPRFLGSVHSGDLISAEMDQQPDGWHLNLVDDTTPLHRSFDSGYARSKRFAAAEWTQEDPLGRSGDPTDLPYPKTTTVEFSHLIVDGRRPPIAFSDGVTLASPNGIYLVPSHPGSDGFSIPAASPLQAQYLADLRPLNFAFIQFSAAATGAGSVGESQAARELEEALTTFRANVEQQRWPSAVTADIDPLIRSISTLIPGIRQESAARRNRDELRSFQIRDVLPL